MTKGVGLKTVDEYLEAIATDAQCIVDDIRTIDPQHVLRGIERQCATAPLRMAQIIMTLAAWVDPDETLTARGTRVEAITFGAVNTPGEERRAVLSSR